MKRFFLLLSAVLFFSVFCASAKQPAKQSLEQMRGVWIATVENIDWPSAAGLSAENQQKELIDIFDKLKKLGFNAVFLQTRPSADTFWPSEFEPCSYYLSGKQGVCANYDPLAFAVEQAHKRGMQLHAWVNPFRVSNNSKTQLAKNHPAQKNKDWLIKYDGKSFYDPGSPDARAHSIKVITEIAQKYKVDGIHLDDYFYPYPDAKKTPFNDKKSYKKYAKKDQGLDDWRRENINAFMRDLKTSLKAASPKIAFGVSPFGIWCNAKDCAGGSDTKGFNSNLVLYSDSRSWLNEGLLDYIAPQIYWHREHKTAPFSKLVDWWALQVKSAPNNPKLYIGIAAYKHAEGEWKNEDELYSQVKYARGNKNVGGFIYFSSSKILNGKRNIGKTILALNK
ncbi:MAG: family 10 glycosylhydrolase [Elusimicrobiota bacterium]|jgi:uncharacterized lipoprotein YddW (UPF0748 family)|nr:family 10 glycosylhydrolase [Elusimicrobiota bacterium]